MAGDFKDTHLGRLLSFSNGRSSPDRADGLPHPVYGSNGIIGYVNETNAGPNSIIIGRVGSYCGSLYLSKQQSWVTDNAIRANARDGNDARFLFYLLGTLSLNNWRVGSGQPLLNQDILSRIPAAVPELDEQRSIAYILGSLDDKIELNRRMNETLEALARALFKSWFVDFGPVRAKKEGRQPVGMDEETAALFPDSFEDSSLGEIPKGWSAGTAGDDFDIIMGQSPPGETYNEIGEGLPFYQGRRDFKFRYPTLRVYCSAPKRTAQYGDALVSVRAPVGDVNMAESVCCVGRGVAAVRHKTGSRSYTYYAMHSLKSYFKRFESEGTVFGAVNKQGFLTIPFLLPPPALVETFESSIYPLDQRIEVQEKQSHTLAEIRDTLLPKLLSGEVRVGEAEEVVKEAL